MAEKELNETMILVVSDYLKLTHIGVYKPV